jgi:flagellar basal body P-ring protein FlgI
MRKAVAFLYLAALFLVLMGGCQEEPQRRTGDLSDTIAAAYKGAQPAHEPINVEYIRDGAKFYVHPAEQVEAYSMVVGLRGTGNQTLPKSPAIQTAIKKVLQFNNIESRLDDVIRAPSTAVVRVESVIPAFAKPNDRIDVTVKGMADTRDLNHGLLLPCQLRSFKYKQTQKLLGEVWAEAAGGYGCTTAIKTGQGQKVETVDPSRAVITDGAIVARPNPVYLWLEGQSARVARRMQTLINQLFPPECAAAITKERVITINVPDMYEGNFDRFSRVIMSIKITHETPQEFETRVENLIYQLTHGTIEEKKNASYELEACGFSVIDRLKSLTQRTADPATKKILVETLAYMRAKGTEQFLESFVSSGNPEDRIFAARFAPLFKGPVAEDILRTLIEDHDIDVSYEASLSLRRMGTGDLITVKDGNNCDFVLVDRKSDPTIVVKNSPRRAIMFFGTGIPLEDTFLVNLEKAGVGFSRRGGGIIQITYVVPMRNPNSVEPEIKTFTKTDDIKKRIVIGDEAALVPVTDFEDVVMAVDYLEGVPFNDIAALVELMSNKRIIKPEVVFKD